ncbi:hypothetical protein ACFLQN_02175 [Candidatus Aenigmatarchaeota archaeon]
MTQESDMGHSDDVPSDWHGHMAYTVVETPYRKLSGEVSFDAAMLSRFTSAVSERHVDGHYGRTIRTYAGVNYLFVTAAGLYVRELEKRRGKGQPIVHGKKRVGDLTTEDFPASDIIEFDSSSE